MEKLINAFEQQEKIMQYLRDITDGKMTFLPSSSSETSNKYNSDYGSASNIVMGYIEYQKELLKTCVQQLEEQAIELSTLEAQIKVRSFSDLYQEQALEELKSRIDKHEFSVEFTSEDIEALQKRFLSMCNCTCGSNCTCQCKK